MWVNTTAEDGRVVQTGQASAVKLGLVTLKGLRVTKARHRITIRRK